MGIKVRAAAVLNLSGIDSRHFFSEELLFKPLIQWLTDALSRSGVEEFLLIAEGSEDIGGAIGHKFAMYARTDRKGAREAIKGLAEGGNAKVITISDTVYFDDALIAELITTLESRSKVILTSGGLPLGVCGFSGNEACDPARISEALQDKESKEGYYELDCLDTGSFGTSIESMEDFCRTEELLRDTVNRRHMQNGVRFIGSDTIFVSPDVVIGTGTTILPNTILKGRTEIGAHCKIGPNSFVNGCKVGERTEINASQVNDSQIGTGVKIGPFAYIRPGCEIGNDIRIGDFVEIKKARIGDNTKISHLTYIGDSEVGQFVNFGCGTVTANYDGIAKHKTIIEDGAFIGCNTNLIAPVHIGKNATTAAGTTVTSDVPEGSLAIGRVRQTIKPDWNKYRKK